MSEGKVLKIDRSIHPRVVGGRTVFPKVNTSKAKNKDRLQRVIAAISEHIDRHPNDIMSQRHLAKLREIA